MLPVIVGLVAFVWLLADMNRTVNLFDEGIILSGAARMMAGAVPHRDFYANYGPAQFAVLAGLFKLFGPSVLVARIWDVVVRAGIVALGCLTVGRVAGAWRGLLASLLSLAVLSKLNGQSTYPVYPALLFTLASAAWLQPGLARLPRPGPLLLAGACGGAVALFRYDVGFATCAAETAVLIAYMACNVPAGGLNRLRRIAETVAIFAAGVAAMFLPWAALYLAVAPLRDFIFDILYFPSHVYPRVRALPFPSLWDLDTDTVLVYFPIAAWLAGALAVWRLSRRPRPLPGASECPPRPMVPDRVTSPQCIWTIILLLALSVALYSKGLVRVSPLHLLISIIPAMMVAAILPLRCRQQPFAAAAALAVLLLALSGLPDMLSAAKRHFVVPNLAWISNGDAWRKPVPGQPWHAGSCRTPPNLQRLACFILDDNRVAAIRFIQEHTSPAEPIYAGTARHDKVFVNDAAFYFLADRPAVTKWYFFDPGLQTSEPVQRAMVAEFAARKPRYLVLESTWDAVQEPNDSALSSGVTLLDDTIHRDYRIAATFGDVAIWQRAAGS